LIVNGNGKVDEGDMNPTGGDVERHRHESSMERARSR
jgi:hypothetical protein